MEGVDVIAYFYVEWTEQHIVLEMQFISNIIVNIIDKKSWASRPLGVLAGISIGHDTAWEGACSTKTQGVWWSSPAPTGGW